MLQFNLDKVSVARIINLLSVLNGLIMVTWGLTILGTIGSYAINCNWNFLKEEIKILTVEHEGRNVQLCLALSTLPALHGTAVPVLFNNAFLHKFVGFLLTIVIPQIAQSSIKVTANCEKETKKWLLIGKHTQ